MDREELLASIDETVAQLLNLASSLDEKEINTVPFKDSWTAGQLLQHVTKATAGIAKAMYKVGNPVGRNVDEKVPVFRNILLDFSSKIKAPEFIVPEEKVYDKQASIEALENAFRQLKASADKADLKETVEGLPMGTVTKIELLHFVLYHTQRHLHQLNNICEALKDKVLD